MLRSIATKGERKRSKMNQENADDNVVPLFNRDLFLDPLKAHKVADRWPLEIRGDPGERRFIGVLEADGALCRPAGLRSPLGTKPLTMRDRLICMDDDTSNAEVIRLGAMTYLDIFRT